MLSPDFREFHQIFKSFRIYLTLGFANFTRALAHLFSLNTAAVNSLQNDLGLKEMHIRAIGEKQELHGVPSRENPFRG